MKKGPGRTLAAHAALALLQHKGGLGWKGAVLAGWAFLSLEWVAHASAPVVEHGLLDVVLGWMAWHPGGLGMKALGIVTPIGSVLLVFWLILRHLRSIEVAKLEPGQAEAEKIQPHRGLIASLSFHPKQNTKAMLDEVGTMVAAGGLAGFSEAARKEFLNFVYGTNWGPLAGALEIHQPNLGYVWLLRSSQTPDEVLALVKKWIALLVGGRVTVKEVLVTDANNVSQVRLLVRGIYSYDVPSCGLTEEQVIADITGGTAAMTSGMILATLEEQRSVEYLNQGSSLRWENGEAKLREQILGLFQRVKTSPEDVAEAYVSFLRGRVGDKGA